VLEVFRDENGSPVRDKAGNPIKVLSSRQKSALTAVEKAQKELKKHQGAKFSNLPEDEDKLTEEIRHYENQDDDSLHWLRKVHPRAVKIPGWSQEKSISWLFLLDENELDRQEEDVSEKRRRRDYKKEMSECEYILKHGTTGLGAPQRRGVQ